MGREDRLIRWALPYRMEGELQTKVNTVGPKARMNRYIVSRVAVCRSCSGLRRAPNMHYASILLHNSTA